MMNKKLKISLAINIIIFILTIIATVFMFFGIQFMGEDISGLLSGKLDALKFFTVESNLLMGIIAFIFSILEIKFLRNKIEYIPGKLYVLKHIATVCVVLTMLTTALFLAPTSKYGYFAMFKNSNLFYHFIIPLLSLITFVFFEKTDKIKFKYTFVAIVPMIMYAVFYAINIFAHMENGIVTKAYDWYGFLKGGITDMFCVIPVIVGATYLISYLIWYFNKQTK